MQKNQHTCVHGERERGRQRMRLHLFDICVVAMHHLTLVSPYSRTELPLTGLTLT